MKEDIRVNQVHERFSESIYPIISDKVDLEEIMLPLDDGVKLRAKIYKAPGKDVYPAILVRTPYPNDEAWYSAIAYEYAKRGFAFVIQFCRGTGGSEGEWEPNVNERSDGKQTIDWMCSLKWIGNVGYMGVSYMALTGWIIADILPEKVKTMYLTHYGVFRHISAYKDGLFRHDVLTAWAMENAGYEVKTDYLESCMYKPHVRASEDLWGKDLEWYKKWVTSTDSNDPYWNEGVWGILKTIPPKVKIPISMSEGWYDHHLGSGIETYKALSDECKGKSEFLIGAWDHWFDVPIEGHTGRHYDNDDLLRAFKWFKEILVDGKKPQGKISDYVIGGDYWTERKKYDIPDQNNIKFYLTCKAECNLLVTDIKDVKKGYASYKYNPENPVPSLGGESMLHTRSSIGSLKQPKSNYRPDVVSFVSEPLQENITALGSIKAHLNVKTDVEDTCFVVKIMNILKDGTSYNVRSGITTLAYRNGSECRKKYKPNEEIEIEIDMWDIAFEFSKGTRIRIDIQSSDFPQYAIHSNMPGIWSEQTHSKIANQTILYGEDKLSYIELPLLQK